MSDHCPPEEVLSAHLDGDLDGDEARRVELHLVGCVTCQSAQQELGALRVELSALAEVEPSRDLWSAIVVRHNQERAPRSWLRFGLPALALAGALATLLVILVQSQAPPTGVDPDIAKAHASVVEAEQTYLDSITALEKAVAGSSVATMRPEARAAVEQALAQIDATIQQCQRELDVVPHDFRAHRTLLAAYQRKVDLLTDLVDRSI